MTAPVRRVGSFAVLLGVLSAACGEPERPAAPAAAAPAPKKKAAEASPPAVATAQTEYSYDPIGKRDPFRPPSMDQLAREANAAEVVCAEPLCDFDLDELQVVAVVSGDANPLAMVEDKNRVGYVVRRNSKMGRQGGKVTQILRDCVVVTNFVTGPDGKAQPNKINLCIQPDARSAPVLDLFEGKLRQ